MSHRALVQYSQPVTHMWHQMVCIAVSVMHIWQMYPKHLASGHRSTSICAMLLSRRFMDPVAGGQPRPVWLEELHLTTIERHRY